MSYGDQHEQGGAAGSCPKCAAHLEAVRKVKEAVAGSARQDEWFAASDGPRWYLTEAEKRRLFALIDAARHIQSLTGLSLSEALGLAADVVVSRPCEDVS